MNPSTDSIERFLQAVAVGLPRPSGTRAEILAELNDGLREATEANQRA